MTKPSLRWVFLVPILVAITAGFTGFAVYADRVERNNRIDDVDAELVRAARAGGESPAAAPLPRPLPQDAGDSEVSADVDNPVQLVIDATGAVVSAGVAGNPFSPSSIDALLAADGFSTVSDENYRARVTRLDDRLTSVTALSLDTIDEATADFRRAVALGGTIILLLVAAIVWWLVRQMTRPITRITRVATRIADGELDIDIEAPSRSREMAELTDDLDRMLTRLRSTLNDNARSAAEATRARDDMQRFLADMAHELRTPLTALKGYSDLYAGGMLAETDDVDRAMSRIGSESERLSRLAEDMLQLARQGATAEPTEAVDVAAVAGEVCDDLRAANPDHHISLATAPGVHEVVGSRARIHQAILNLGSNACHHSDPADEIAVSIESSDGRVQLRVVDHGPGIAEQDRDRIFLPFFRADASRSRNGATGAGLGLALTKQIADQHRGTIAYETTPGGGATFVLALPSHAENSGADH